MSERVLLLGAGLVAAPLVRYLIDHGVALTIAANNPARASEIAGDHARVVDWDADDASTLRQLVGESAVVVSLLPASMHVGVARACIDSGASLVTASYVSDEMQQLDGAARAAGVTLLCELGVDPGIDHMSAMAVLDEARARGASAASFRSYCGGLPAPDANDNPWGYKLSWSPIGVLRAAKSAARFLADGEVVELSAERLGEATEPVAIGELRFEGYPNRDSLAYRARYKLELAHTLLRGTLRWPGWVAATRALDALGLLDDEPVASATSWAALLRASAGIDAAGAEGLRDAVAQRLGDEQLVERLAWLGLFEEAALPERAVTRIEALAGQMSARMAFGPGERDLLVMRHSFLFAERDGSERAEHADLVVYGEPDGDSAMARTVGLPAAMGARMLLDRRLERQGVLLPLERDVYAPLLAELAEHGIALAHEVES